MPASTPAHARSSALAPTPENDAPASPAAYDDASPVSSAFRTDPFPIPSCLLQRSVLPASACYSFAPIQRLDLLRRIAEIELHRYRAGGRWDEDAARSNPVVVACGSRAVDQTGDSWDAARELPSAKFTLTRKALLVAVESYSDWQLPPQSTYQ